MYTIICALHRKNFNDEFYHGFVRFYSMWQYVNANLTLNIKNIILWAETIIIYQTCSQVFSLTEKYTFETIDLIAFIWNVQCLSLYNCLRKQVLNKSAILLASLAICVFPELHGELFMNLQCLFKLFSWRQWDPMRIELINSFCMRLTPSSGFSANVSHISGTNGNNWSFHSCVWYGPVIIMYLTFQFV